MELMNHVMNLLERMLDYVFIFIPKLPIVDEIFMLICAIQNNNIIWFLIYLQKARDEEPRILLSVCRKKRFKRVCTSLPKYMRIVSLKSVAADSY